MSEEESDDLGLADDWGDALAEQGIDGISAAEMEDFSDARGDGEEINLDVVLDVPVTLSMEVGTTMITIRNLLQLTQGSVVELDRLAGETLDIKANGTLIAHGEVVVVNEKFGIRVLDVVTPEERIRKIKE
jgi:flagellar motor switch protein FliN/FliY